jgi:hypothetical protein
MTNSLFGALWPEETAWKLRVTFRPEPDPTKPVRGADPDEKRAAVPAQSVFTIEFLAKPTFEDKVDEGRKP